MTPKTNEQEQRVRHIYKRLNCLFKHPRHENGPLSWELGGDDIYFVCAVDAMKEREIWHQKGQRLWLTPERLKGVELDAGTPIPGVEFNDVEALIAYVLMMKDAL